jgi:hypothetical protein
MIINQISQQNDKINKSLQDWLHKKDYNEMNITPRELNFTFELLSKSSNPYCKNNFIDYNFMVDKILEMSQPYSETKNNRGNLMDVSQIGSNYIHDTSVIGNLQKDKSGLDHSFINHIENSKNNNNQIYYPIPIGGGEYKDKTKLMKEQSINVKLKRIESDNDIFKSGSNYLNNNDDFNKWGNMGNMFESKIIKNNILADLYKQNSNLSDLDKNDFLGNLIKGTSYGNNINNNTNISNITNFVLL